MCKSTHRIEPNLPIYRQTAQACANDAPDEAVFVNHHPPTSFECFYYSECVLDYEARASLSDASTFNQWIIRRVDYSTVCLIDVVVGCANPNACNYNKDANNNYNSLVHLDVGGKIALLTTARTMSWSVCTRCVKPRSAELRREGERQCPRNVFPNAFLIIVGEKNKIIKKIL